MLHNSFPNRVGAAATLCGGSRRRSLNSPASGLILGSTLYAEVRGTGDCISQSTPYLLVIHILTRAVLYNQHWESPVSTGLFGRVVLYTRRTHPCANDRRTYGASKNKVHSYHPGTGSVTPITDVEHICSATVEVQHTHLRVRSTPCPETRIKTRMELVKWAPSSAYVRKKLKITAKQPFRVGAFQGWSWRHPEDRFQGCVYVGSIVVCLSAYGQRVSYFMRSW